MYYFIFIGFFSTIFLSGCLPSKDRSDASGHVAISDVLGNAQRCQQYTGLPDAWPHHKDAGMINIPAGHLSIGNNQSYPEEKALYQKTQEISAFLMDATEVTNAQFEYFVQQTGYITEAEQQGEAAVFKVPEQATAQLTWWSLEKDASWRFPAGKHKQQPIQPHQPVRMITLKDAMAYAQWLGHDLPTEQQWEYAAKAGQSQDTTSNQVHIHANIWQGTFPYENQEKDGYAGVAPVGCFEPNAFGLYDMIGNVWEYTQTPFLGSHDDHMGVQKLNIEKTKNLYTIKGGSYLCAQNYCQRYRAAARHPQEIDLAISHVGFRTVKNLK
jgi:formylglycine-generating enzyme